jgi:tetratricopeptide (TPR) repeat protein
LDWAASLPHLETLSNENYFSKAFYVYQIGMVMHIMGKDEEAKEQLRQVSGLVVRKFGGKTLQVESFVLRKAAYLLDLLERKSFPVVVDALRPVHGLEIVYLWNGFSIMDRDALAKAFELVLKSIEELNKVPAASPKDKDGDADQLISKKLDMHATLYAMAGTLCRELGKEKDAETFFSSAIREENLTMNNYVKPFAQYDMGVYFIDRGLKDPAVSVSSF